MTRTVAIWGMVLKEWTDRALPPQLPRVAESLPSLTDSSRQSMQAVVLRRKASRGATSRPMLLCPMMMIAGLASPTTFCIACTQPSVL